MLYRAVLITALVVIPACGFGVGSFHNKIRSGSHYVGSDNKYRYYQRTTWEDVSGTYNIHIGYKVGASFASAPGRGTAVGRLFEIGAQL